MTLHLQVEGLAKPLQVSIGPRTVFLGPHGSGKTTALRCLELALRGHVEALGPVAGALAKLVGTGESLRFMLHGDPEHRHLAGAAFELRANQAKAAPAVRGAIVQTGRLPMTGSVEEVRAFLSQQLGSAVRAQMTPSRLDAALGMLVPRYVSLEAVASNPIGALAVELESQRVESKRRREEATRQKKHTEAIEREFAAAAAKAPTTPPHLLEKELEALLEARGGRAAPEARAAELRDQRRSLERHIDQVRAALAGAAPLPDPAVDVAALKARLATLSQDLEAAKAAVGEAVHKEDEARLEATATRTAAAIARSKVAEVEKFLELIPGTSCPTCARPLTPETLRELAAHLGELDGAAIELEEQAALAAEVHSSRSRVLTQAQQTEAAAREAWNQGIGEEDRLRSAALARKSLRDADENRRRQAAEQLARLEASLAQLPDVAPAAEDLAPWLSDMDHKISEARSALSAARQWNSSRIALESAQDATEGTKRALETSMRREAQIRDVRDRLVDGPLRRALERLAPFCYAMPSGRCTPELYLGDPEADPPEKPFFGVVREGRRVSIAALSTGEQAAFLGVFAAALLEQAPGDPEERFLFLDTDLVGAMRQTLLGAIADSAIGTIVVAFPDPMFRPSKKSPWPAWTLRTFEGDEFHASDDAIEGAEPPLPDEPVPHSPPPPAPKKRRPKKAAESKTDAQE